MRLSRLLVILLAGISFYACVPNKQLVYLQQDDLHTTPPKDTVLRSYQLDFENYKIQPQDVLSVQFQSVTEEEYDIFADFGMGGAGGGGGQGLIALRGELVDPQGNIAFPVVGNVKVAGKTVFEVQEMLQEIAADFVEDPVIKVRLLNFRFTVLGEVNAETTVTTQNTRTTFMEAIAIAGGLGELADRENVKVIRQKGETAEVFYVNLLEEEFLESDKFYVYQNDVIIVPPLKQRTFRRYYSQNLSLILSSISAILFIASISNLIP